VKKRKRRLPPPIRLGPILHARGVQGDRWRVSASFLLEGEEEPPDLTVDGVRLDVPPRFLFEWKPTPAESGQPVQRLWRYDFAVPRGAQDGRVGYGFVDDGERRWYLAVPGTAIRPRFAYVSCGGCESEPGIAAKGLTRNARWAHLLGRHRAEPYHMMLMGGDQVYADAVWDLPWLKHWSGLPSSRRLTEEPPPELAAELDAFYREVYRWGFGQAETAAMLASAPVFAMWDDHDIFDGWGSHPDRSQDSPVFRAIWEAAKRAFRLFQLGAHEEPPETIWGPPGTNSQGMVLNGVGVLAPDLRSERRRDSVMSPESRALVPGWLERFRGCRHLLLMSSVPMVFPAFPLTERLMMLIPGQEAFEDDLRDQWRSVTHKAEWREWLARLAAFSRDARCRVTVLSGEIHLGGSGVVRGDGFEMWQLIASGIVHPPPGGLAVDILERSCRGREKLPDGLVLEMPPFEESGRTLLRTRNWLSLTIEPDGALLAEWHAETGPTPLVRRLPAL